LRKALRDQKIPLRAFARGSFGKTFSFFPPKDWAVVEINV
jgi:hypothetical protein